MATSLISKKLHIVDPLSVAIQTIDQEIQGLHDLKGLLSSTFAQVINLILRSKGRLIISGMGKSGHIAKKMAATLASTGQPSFFVHPGEAAHGDLGMISSGDVLLLISNSGESQELFALLNYAKRFSIPVIGMTKNEKSTLGTLANYCLLLPKTKEACPNGLAPTTSTTATLALGDALAVSLLTHRGFSNHDFQTFHPGGKLGQQLKPVKNFMHKGKKLPVICESTKMSEALIQMSSFGFGVLGLTDDQGALSGVLTDGDLRRHMGNDFLNKKAGDVMTPDPITITDSTVMSEALAIMEAKTITSLFITDTKESLKPTGFIHIHDCLRAGVA